MPTNFTCHACGITEEAEEVALDQGHGSLYWRTAVGWVVSSFEETLWWCPVHDPTGMIETVTPGGQIWRYPAHCSTCGRPIPWRCGSPFIDAGWTVRADLFENKVTCPRCNGVMWDGEKLVEVNHNDPPSSGQEQSG